MILYTSVNVKLCNCVVMYFLSCVLLYLLNCGLLDLCSL